MLTLLFAILICGQTMADSPSQKCGVCKCNDKTMDCSMRHIATLGHTEVDRNIKVFNISYNKLQDLARENFLTDSLVSLDISNNAINRISWSTFSRCTSLVYLSLSRNNIGWLEDKSFLGLSNLQVLDLSKNSITHVLPGTFEHIQRIRKLNLSNNFIGRLYLSPFANLNYLEELNLSGNFLVQINIGIFPRTLSLLNVYLSSNKLSYLYGNTSVTLQLSLFDVSNNNLKKLTAGSLAGLAYIHEINVSNNSIASIDSELLCIVSKRRIQVVFTNNPLTCDDRLKMAISECGTAEFVDFMNNCSSVTPCQGHICEIPTLQEDRSKEVKFRDSQDSDVRFPSIKNETNCLTHLLKYSHFKEISFFVIVFVLIGVSMLLFYLKIRCTSRYYRTLHPERLELIQL